MGSRSAFTLIELLAVLVLLALLASLLLPGLSRAKTRVQGIVCLNHTKQLLTAWLLYAGDHQDQIPGARQWEPSPGRVQPDWTRGSWLSLIDPADESNWNVDAFIRPSVLFPYGASAPGVWRCPADRSTGLDARGRCVPRIRSYSMNGWVGGEGWDASGPWRPRDPAGWLVYLKASEMTEPGPSSTWVFMDEREDSINDGYFIVDMAGYPDQAAARKLVDFPASYHGQAAALSFADGHGQLHRWSDSRTCPPLVRGQNLLQNVPSPNNLDIFWLQERSTRGGVRP